MTRVTAGIRRRRKHKKILKLAKGYEASRRRVYKIAKETVLKAGEYAFAGRKDRKRDFRKLWIIRINAALKERGLRYSTFINKLKKNNIMLDRKSLSNLTSDKESFDNLLNSLKK